MDTSLGSGPIYNDSDSYSESNEDIDDILSTFEWELSHQNVAWVEDAHLIIDMLNKEYEQVANTSSCNSKVTVSTQEQSDVKEEAPLSHSAHQGAHDHLHQASSPFLKEERDQPITNFCKGDVEVEEAEQVQSCLKEEFVFVPQIQIERQLSDASCPSFVDLQQGVLIHEFQDSFTTLLKTLDEKTLKTYLMLTSVHDLSSGASP